MSEYFIKENIKIVRWSSRIKQNKGFGVKCENVNVKMKIFKLWFILFVVSCFRS